MKRSRAPLLLWRSGREDPTCDVSAFRLCNPRHLEILVVHLPLRADMVVSTLVSFLANSRIRVGGGQKECYRHRSTPAVLHVKSLACCSTCELNTLRYYIFFSEMLVI